MYELAILRTFSSITREICVQIKNKAHHVNQLIETDLMMCIHMTFSNVMIMEPYAPHPYKLLQGRKKQQILTEDGYVFTKERQYKDKAYYKCIRSFDGCKSRLTMCSNSKIITRYAPSHSHIADPVDNTVRELKSRMKDSSKERNGATLVIADTVSGATDEVLSQLSTNTAMSHMIWRERKDKNIPRGPQNLESDIPQDMTTLQYVLYYFFSTNSSFQILMLIFNKFNKI